MEYEKARSDDTLISLPPSAHNNNRHYQIEKIHTHQSHHKSFPVSKFSRMSLTSTFYSSLDVFITLRTIIIIIYLGNDEEQVRKKKKKRERREERPL